MKPPAKKPALGFPLTAEVKRALAEDAEASGSMSCPHCSSGRSRVVSTRFRKRNNALGSGIRRSRECLTCGKKFATLEVHQEAFSELMKLKFRVVRFSRAVMASDSMFNQLRILMGLVDPNEPIPRNIFKETDREE